MCILWVNPVKLRKEVYFQCLWNIWLITDNPYFQVHASRFDFPTGAPYNGTLDVWEFQTIKHMFKKKKEKKRRKSNSSPFPMLLKQDFLDYTIWSI